MKLLIKKLGIYLMMLLYGFILIPFNNEQTSLLEEFNFITETTQSGSSDVSKIKIYFSEIESELKVFSETKESNKQKKNQAKQYFTVSSLSDFSSDEFTSENVMNKVHNCNSQADFNYVTHSFW